MEAVEEELGGVLQTSQEQVAHDRALLFTDQLDLQLKRSIGNDNHRDEKAHVEQVHQVQDKQHASNSKPSSTCEDNNCLHLHDDGATAKLKELDKMHDINSTSIILRGDDLTRSTVDTVARSRPGVPDFDFFRGGLEDDDVDAENDCESLLADVETDDEDDNVAHWYFKIDARAAEAPLEDAGAAPALSFDDKVEVDQVAQVQRSESDNNCSAGCRENFLSGLNKLGEDITVSNARAAQPDEVEEPARDPRDLEADSDSTSVEAPRLNTPPLSFTAQCANGLNWLFYWSLEKMMTGVAPCSVQVVTGFLWLFLYRRHYRADLYKKELRTQLCCLGLHVAGSTTLFALTLLKEVSMEAAKTIFAALGSCTGVALLGAPALYARRAWVERDASLMGSWCSNFAGLLVQVTWALHTLRENLVFMAALCALMASFSLLCLAIRVRLCQLDRRKNALRTA
eukprot:g9801.t1